MCQHGAHRSHPHAAADAENSIASRDGQIAQENAVAESAIIFSRPTRPYERAYKGSDAAPTEQDAHAEHGTSGGVDAVAMNGKFPRPHDREDHPTRPDHEFS